MTGYNYYSGTPSSNYWITTINNTTDINTGSSSYYISIDKDELKEILARIKILEGMLIPESLKEEYEEMVRKEKENYGK